MKCLPSPKPHLVSKKSWNQRRSGLSVKYASLNFSGESAESAQSQLSAGCNAMFKSPKMTTSLPAACQASTRNCNACSHQLVSCARMAHAKYQRVQLTGASHPKMRTSSSACKTDSGEGQGSHSGQFTLLRCIDTHTSHPPVVLSRSAKPNSDSLPWH